MRGAPRWQPVLLSLAAAFAIAPAGAWAHAALVESSPRDGEALTAPPPAAVLRFNAKIEKRLTRVTLDGPDGRSVALQPAPEQAGEPADRVSIPLPALGPGAYRLSYRVLAADGHATPGLIRFTVQGGPAR